MAILYLNGKRLKQLIHASTQLILANEKVLNELNVFPVPDGDTGTNLGLTLKNVIKSISDTELDNHLPNVASNIATAAVLGARGNSGVILSQIFKGFSEGIGDEKTRLNALDIAYALKKAYEKAYNSISNPVEGTILTVVRDSVNAGYEKAKTESDITILIETILNESRKSLMNTPNLLPTLKEAGVVDAGALGFVYIIEGVYRLLKGHSLPEMEISHETVNQNIAKKQGFVVTDFYGYCNEFFIHNKNLDTNAIRTKLLALGESLIMAEADNMVKIHIHSRSPGRILEECLKYGVLTDIKIENMDAQHSQRGKTVIEKETVIIAVSLGEGVKKIFESLGCDYIIKGGQTMNPSVEELNMAIHKLKAKNYIILPNNSNVIFTAEQLKIINENKNIIIIPTQSIPEGFSAILAYNPEFSVDENIKNMNLAIKRVKTGEITVAVKDSTLNRLSIKKGDIIALYNNSVINVFTNSESAVFELINTMFDGSDSIVSLYYGQDTSETEARMIETKLKEKYNNLEIEMHHGGQPHYLYIISIE